MSASLIGRSGSIRCRARVETEPEGGQRPNSDARVVYRITEMRPGLFQSYSGRRREAAPQSVRRVFPCRGTASAYARKEIRVQAGCDPWYARRAQGGDGCGRSCQINPSLEIRLIGEVEGDFPADAWDFIKIGA